MRRYHNYNRIVIWNKLRPSVFNYKIVLLKINTDFVKLFRMYMTFIFIWKIPTLKKNIINFNKYLVEYCQLNIY